MLPGATAKSVGLTAATTVPCAETSRTNGPSVTVARAGVLGGAPAADQEAEDEDQHEAARGEADHFLARAVGLRGDGQVLSVGAADRSVAGGRRIPPAGRQGT